MKWLGLIAALVLVGSALAQPPLPPEISLPINISLPTTTTIPEKGRGFDLLALLIGFGLGVTITLSLVWILSR